MKREFLFEISRKILINANTKYHYMDKANRARKLRELSRSSLDKLESPLFNKFDVDIYIYPPTRRRLDPPNLYPTVKHLIDGLTDSNLWEDDDFTRMLSMTFRYGGISGVKDTFLIKIIVTENAQ